MKKHSERNSHTFEDLIGLGNHSARKSYYPELSQKLDELEAEKNRYKWLFDNALHGIFRAEFSGKILAANPAMAHICGYMSAAHLISEVENLEHLFCDELAYQRLSEGLLQDNKVFRYETRLRRANGDIIHVSMNALLKREAHITTIEAFVQDISERVNDQARLKRLNEELEQRVDERTSALAAVNAKLWEEIREREVAQQQMRQAKEQAEEANRGKDKYLAAASHDLLQPMNAARLLVSTLRERSLAVEDSHLVERIHVALEGAEDLLTDLLDISKLDQNAVQPDVTTFHLSQLLNTLQTEFQPVAEQAKLQFKVRSSDFAVQSDARLLMRILRNFVSNAIRYTSNGGVLVGCRKRGDALNIQVWDTGEGIPADHLQDIFKEFNQLEQHRNGMRTGVGLGLAIVERISSMLDHPIYVASRVKRGSLFSITVPLAQYEPPIAATVRRQPVGEFAAAPVLVVDNDPDILLSMQVLLTQWGLKPYLAQDETRALELCKALGVPPAVVLLDYHLDNGYTGPQVWATLEASLGVSIPAVMITAERGAEALKFFREKGLQVLNKPVKPNKLRALLMHILSHAE